MNPTPVIAENREHLIRLIAAEIAANGYQCSLNHIDVSGIQTLHDLFSTSNSSDRSFALFDGDISQWDVSNVIDFSWMFAESRFNGNISSWDVSNSLNMTGMFCQSQFNGDISDWQPSQVQSIDYIFEQSLFSGDISQWRLRSDTMTPPFQAFESTHFKSDISQLGLSDKQVEQAFAQLHEHYIFIRRSIEERQQLLSSYTDKPKTNVRKTL
jgi:hypothetical protein